MIAFNVAEWLNISLVAALAIISPGPCFLMSLKNTLYRGRGSGVMTASGIALGDLLHAFFSLFGLSILVVRIPQAFEIVKMMGAIYLIYLGMRGILSKSQGDIAEQDRQYNNDFLAGFFVVLLNPKAWIFYICLASALVSSETSFNIRVFYSFWIGFVSIGWFSMVAFVFSHQSIYQKVFPYFFWIERVMGAVLIYIGIRVMFLSTPPVSAL